MPEPGTPTFDQLKVFLAVVETGSLAAAGRRLNRATSAISYAIANLELQLGLALFDRQSTRRPTLTVAGGAVLVEARAIANGIDALRAKTRGLLQGLEAQITLAIDVLLPIAQLANVLKEFQIAFPTVTLRLHAEALGAVAALVLDGQAQLGISGPLATELDGLEHLAIGSVPLIPVAAPHHPLALMDPIPPGAGRDHLQLVLTDRSPITEGRDFSVTGLRTWRLADLSVKHALLREGIGWGNMPVPMVESDLENGSLVSLDLPEGRGGNYRLAGIYRSDTPLGPAGSWLLNRFSEQATTMPAQQDFSDV
jgi:DNA-binding transcriptional LysR family regulator